MDSVKRQKIREVLAKLRKQGSGGEEPGKVDDMFPVVQPEQLDGIAIQPARASGVEKQLAAYLSGKKKKPGEE